MKGAKQRKLVIINMAKNGNRDKFPKHYCKGKKAF